MILLEWRYIKTKYYYYYFVKLRTVIFVVILHYKYMYINSIIAVMTLVLVDRIVCF